MTVVVRQVEKWMKERKQDKSINYEHQWGQRIVAVKILERMN